MTPGKRKRKSKGFKDRLLAHFRRLGARFWITFLLACVIVQGAEVAFEKLLTSPGNGSEIANSLVVATGLYQSIVTFPRAPLVRSIALVEIDPSRDIHGVSKDNVCAERAFLAQLLSSIEDYSPAGIVIDKYFKADSCAEGDPGTQALEKVIQTIRSQGRPVVVGVKANVSGSGDSAKSVVEPSLAFAGPNAASQEGILNIAADYRRLPLQWNVYKDEQSLKRGDTPVVRDSLALATAKLFDATAIRQNSRLNRILAEGKQPFIAFIQSGQFLNAHDYASALVCPDASSLDGWRKCKQPSDRLRDELQSRIVLVGETNSDTDQHPMLTDRVAGFYLQANYIEALLDDRFYTPGPLLLDYGFAFAFLFALELILIRCEHHPAHATLLITALTAASALVLHLVTLLFGTYIDPLPVSLTAVLIKLSHLIYAQVRPSV